MDRLSCKCIHYVTGHEYRTARAGGRARKIVRMRLEGGDDPRFGQWRTEETVAERTGKFL